MKVLALTSLIICFLSFGCSKKEQKCQDLKMKNEHKNDICTTDCPGVVGCDGKTYCNECEANRNGIEVVE